MKGLRTAEEVLRHVAEMDSDRKTVDAVRQEIADHVIGKRDFDIERTPGEVRTRRIYDSTGMFSGMILASAIQNFVANVQTELFELVTEDPRLMESLEAREWVEEAQRTLKFLMARPEAGWTAAMQEALIDDVFFGMLAMFVEDVPGLPIRYSARPVSEIYITENAAGTVDTVWRKFRLTARQAAQRFPQADMPRVRKALKEAPHQKFLFWHGVHPTSDPMWTGPQAKPWRSVFAAFDDKELVEERGLERNPYKVSRWEKHAGEVYGRGPGWTALPEQRMLNSMSKTLIENAQLKARPPVAIADDDVLNPLNLNPEGRNVIRASGFTSDPIRLLETTGDTGLAVEMFDRRREAVRSAFMHDLLEILRSPITTATQVVEMVQRSRSLFAPTVARMEAEFLEPVINDSFVIALRAGAFPPPPPVLSGARLNVRYKNPVARSQLESDSQALDAFLGFIGNVAEIAPSVLDNVDFDAAVRSKQVATGVPSKLLRTVEEVRLRREEQARLAEEQRQMQMASEGAQALGAAAPALQAMQQEGAA